jgi:AraC-like DNA-binding protein
VDAFSADIRSVEVDALKVYDVGADQRTTVIRSDSDLDRRTTLVDDYIFLGIQTRGTGRLDQSGRTVHLAQGDAALYETRSPFRLRFDAPHRMLVVRMPAAQLRSRLRGLGTLAGVRFAGSGRTTRSIVHVVSALVNTDSSVSWRAQSSLTTAFYDVRLEAVLHERSSRPPIGPVQVEDAKRIARLHVTDPEFTTQTWAGRLGLSDRYLRVLFAATGESPGDYLRAQRLELAATKLADPRYQDVSITDIALSCGFGSSAHFSRVFRAAFGVPPRQRRHDALLAANNLTS